MEGHNKVSLELSLLQAEQPQLSQPVLIGEVLQPSDNFCQPSLALQRVHVFPVLKAPELDAGLQVRSHQSGAEGQNHLPQPAAQASLDAAQDTVGLLGCELTFVAHVKLFIHQCLQILLDRAALSPFIPQPGLIVGVALTQMQHLTLHLVEPHEVTESHFSSLSRSLSMASCPSGVSAAPLSLLSSANLLRMHSISLSHWRKC